MGFVRSVLQTATPIRPFVRSTRYASLATVSGFAKIWNPNRLVTRSAPAASVSCDPSQDGVPDVGKRVSLGPDRLEGVAGVWNHHEVRGFLQLREL